MFQRKRQNTPKKGNSLMKTLVNIATIVSATVTCFRLTLYGIIPFNWTVIVILGVVALVAIGNDFSKIALAGVALFLFILFYSNGERTAFIELGVHLLALIIALIGVYIMIRAAFRR